MAFLFSVQAGAVDSNVQIQKSAPAPVQTPQPHFRYNNYPYYNQTPAIWVTHSVQRVDVSYSQTNPQGGNSAGSASQDLKQFSQQTQQQMANFSKL
jgi:hypothetical protein